jgi:hypothetical protein
VCCSYFDVSKSTKVFNIGFARKKSTKFVKILIEI